jgi:hypothetical protein
MTPTEEANSESHYILIVVAIIIGISGIYLRFLNFPHNTLVANLLLLVGVGVALKAVFAILK